jgi:hypothetical protein
VSFQLYFTARAQSDRQELKDAPSKAGLLKQVNKALGYLQINPRHPSGKSDITVIAITPHP